MRATNHDLKLKGPDVEALLAQYAHGQMFDEHTIALIARLKRDRPEGFVSRNKRRDAMDPSNN